MSAPGVSILFVGGVSPDVTQDDLVSAFAQHTEVLAASVVREPTSGKCVGQAYVTVPAVDVDKARAVSVVGANSVCVFPVVLEAYVSPEAGLEEGDVQPEPPQSLQSAEQQQQPHSQQQQQQQQQHGGAAAAGLGPAAGAMAAPMPAPAPAAGGGPSSWSLPHTASVNVHLIRALEQLRQHLQSNPRLAFGGKPWFMLLNEVGLQKRGLTAQVGEGPDGGAFGCTITLLQGGNAVCSGHGTGTNKRDAKHAAAAACLDMLLAGGQLPSAELMAAMVCSAPAQGVAPAGMGGGANGSGNGVASAAAATAMSQTATIMRLGLYPRVAEVMQAVHATEAGRLKTVLMVLNEHSSRTKLPIQHEELPSANPTTGPFRFITRVIDPTTQQPLAQATGVELRSKQEAKQAAAAALLEDLINRGVTTVEALTGGRK